MKREEFKKLASVTDGEVNEVKNSIVEWSRTEIVLGALVENIRKMEKQIDLVEQMSCKNELTQDMAKEANEILQKRLISLLEIHTKATLNAMKMEAYISMLDNLEQTIIFMKYSKGLNTEYISARLHISRATLFRKQERAFKEIALMRREMEKVN